MNFKNNNIKFESNCNKINYIYFKIIKINDKITLLIMTQIIDYRNGRYQGQSYQGYPDGLGNELNNLKVSLSITIIYFVWLNGELDSLMVNVL